MGTLTTISPPNRQITRRGFLKAGACATAGLALYAGEIERHRIDVSHYNLRLPGLGADFDGYRIAQLSDIHIDEFTEPYFVREAVERINQLQPDAVFLTGDFVTHQIATLQFSEGSAWQCANILNRLHCRQRYAIYGNHDLMVGEDIVGAALRDNAITVLRNSYLPVERGGSRFWVAGIDDPLMGHPNIDPTVPALPPGPRKEPVILLCHEPDYVDEVARHRAGQVVDVVLSGHTHGGQVRIPFMPAIHLPPLGHRYVEGWFQVGSMRLFVNRGLGTVGVPFRFDCPPEITLFTLRA